jgi:hypothetical protein
MFYAPPETAAIVLVLLLYFLAAFLILTVVVLVVRSRWFHRQVRGHTVGPDPREARLVYGPPGFHDSTLDPFYDKFRSEVCSCGKTWP